MHQWYQAIKKMYPNSHNNDEFGTKEIDFLRKVMRTSDDIYLFYLSFIYFLGLSFKFGLVWAQAQAR